MGFFDMVFSLGCAFELLLLPFKLLIAFVRRFKHETAMFLIVLASSVLWVDYYNVSVLTMELNLLSKLGWNISYEIYEVPVILGVYLVPICLRKISQWTSAACYGCISSFAVSSLVFAIRLEVPDFQAPKLIVFVVVLVSSVLFMRMGFHKIDNWVSTSNEIIDLVVGIVPSLIFSFLTVCTLFTITFGEAVINKFSFVVIAIILEIVLYVAGIVFFFIFKEKYMWIIIKKYGDTDALRESVEIVDKEIHIAE